MDALKEKIISTYKKTFGNSFIKISEATLGGQTDLFVRIAFGKDRSQWTNHIVENDPMYNLLMISPTGDGKFVVECSINGGIRIADTTGVYYSSRVKSFRKFSGDESAVLKGLDSFFQKLRDSIKSNRDRFAKLMPIDPGYVMNI